MLMLKIYFNFKIKLINLLLKGKWTPRTKFTSSLKDRWNCSTTLICRTSLSRYKGLKVVIPLENSLSSQIFKEKSALVP